MGRDADAGNLKRQVKELLERNDFEGALRELRKFPASKTVNYLLQALCDAGERKWRAVEAIGEIVAGEAERDMEFARNFMRRLMWSLNDESGGIGWGAPEAMGEIMARNEALAAEFAHVLVSYIRPDGNYLEYEPLQRGVVWAISRLAEENPESVKDAPVYLKPFLESNDEQLRELSAWALKLVGNDDEEQE